MGRIVGQCETAGGKGFYLDLTPGGWVVEREKVLGFYLGDIPGG